MMCSPVLYARSSLASSLTPSAPLPCVMTHLCRSWGVPDQPPSWTEQVFMYVDYIKVWQQTNMIAV